MRTAEEATQARSHALYQARVAYTKEAKRLGMSDEINSRCLIVAIDAFNEAFSEPVEEAEVIE